MAKTFLHEFGHGLGLGHSLVPQAIMSYSLEKNTFALDLDDDMVGGVLPCRWFDAEAASWLRDRRTHVEAERG